MSTKDVDVVAAFRREPWYPLLQHRAEGFEFALEYLSQRPLDSSIVETGTTRVKDNWTGDGQSTRIWNWYYRWAKEHLHELHWPIIWSVDCDQNAIDIAKELCPEVNCECSDSIQWLNSYEDINAITLLYLDSYDWSQEKSFQSCLHHLLELTAVWAALPSGALVMVDDCHTRNLGKHVLIQEFMAAVGIEPAYVGYQTGWIKP